MKKYKTENPVKSSKNLNGLTLIVSRSSEQFLLASIMLMLSVTLYAQKDVTEFLGIPVDGNKSEMIQKLKDKGFTIDPHEKDVLDGEFNGIDVQIFIVTNNNKVRRIAVVDANPTSETNIKIRFNNLLQQFQTNNKYLFTPDSTIQKYTIPESENISYELLVNKKPYQAVFYQKTADYDSLTLKINTLNERQKQTPNDTTYINQLTTLALNQLKEAYKCFNKKVWINMSERSGGYYITIFYDNVNNEANGEDL